MSPRLHWTTVGDPRSAEQTPPLPPLTVALTKPTVAGNVSKTSTSRAHDGPRLVTVRTYVRFAPASTGSGESVFVILRSALAVTSVVVVARLLELLLSAVSLDTP